MPAILTHKSIMLLARERVVELRDLLRRKVEPGGENVTTLDRQLLAIATETARVFSSDPKPQAALTDGILFADPVGADGDRYPVSQYAVLGSMGPDITAFSHLLAPGQAWVFDSVHKGTPDPDRELVNAQTCDLVMHLWKRANTLLESAYSDVGERNAKLDRIRAYVLGHLCHIAADVVSHPYINDYQWQDPPQDVIKFHGDIEAEMDALVARDLLRRDSTRSGQDWDLWWPSEDVPDEFFQAYADALQTVYSAADAPRPGYREFREELEELGAESMDADFVRDGYNMLRHGIVAKGYGYGYWSWWGWLALLVVPAIALPLVVAGLPHGGKIFLDNEDQRDERAWMEFLSTPLLFSLPASIGYGGLLGSLTTGGVRARYWLSMSGGILSAVAGIAMLATTGVNRLSPGVSWTLFFGLPLVLALVQAIIGFVELAKGHGHGGHMAIAFIFALPLAMLALFFVFFGIIPGLAAPASATTSPFKSPGFWIAFALWTIGLLLFWFLIPPVLRDARIPEQPAGGVVTRRFVRLFDDTALHRDDALEGADIPREVYPSGRRKLATLWWTGTGSLFIRSDRHQLLFAADEAGTDPQVVPAPLLPTTLQEYLQMLEATVRQPGGSDTGLLKFKLFEETADDYQLPAGAVFGNHGDGEEDRAGHDARAQTFIQLGSADEEGAYTLYHAFKPALGISYGRRGAAGPERNFGIASPLPEREVEEEGYDYIHQSDSAIAGPALMSIAGDFGAILSMGAITHMSSELTESEDNPVNPVYQVFRNWNLDRRRVNEWRAIVEGGARSEKGANRAGYDDHMLGEGLQPADHGTWQEALLGSSQAAFDEGEGTARQLGWVSLLREWSDLARDGSQNPLATTAMKPGNPSNQALSRAMAWLFDLADPTGAP